MSGIEVVGLVVGAFPLVFQAIDYWQKGCGPLGDWRRFKPMLKKLKLDADIEEVLLRQHIEMLLRLTIDTEDDAAAVLEAVAKGQIPEGLEDSLKDYLCDSYSIFKGILLEMKQTMQKVHEVLGIEDGSIQWMKEQPDWKYQFRRIKIPLKKKVVTEHLAQLSRGNDKLSRLIGNTRRLAPAKESRRQSKAVATFQRIREASLNLYAALSQCWQCQCESHAAGLFLGDVALHEGSIAFSICLDASFGWREASVKASAHNAHDRPAPTSGHAGVRKETLPARSCPRQVRFADPALSMAMQVTTWSLFETRSQECLCTALTGKSFNLNSILSTKGCQFAITSTDTSHIGSALTLDAMFTTPPGLTTLSRAQRMSLAAQCSESLLQLYKTPWVRAGAITSTDVTFLAARSTNGPMRLVKANRPLIMTQFVGVQRTVTPTSDDVSTRDLLQKFAILLLELCFGQSIKTIDLREKHLGPDGQALALTDLATASDWHKRVLGEAGPQYADVVERCLYLNFGITNANIDHEDFRQVVYDNVIVPLQAIAGAFDPA